MTLSYTQTTSKENNNMNATRRRSLRLSASNSNDVAEITGPVASTSKVLLPTPTKTKIAKTDTKKRKLKVEPEFVGRKKARTTTREACSSDAEQDADDLARTHGHFTRSRKSLSRTCTPNGYLSTTTSEAPATPPKKRGRPAKSKAKAQVKPSSISLPSPTTTPPTTPTSKRLTLVALSRQSSHDDLESADLPLPSPVISRAEDAPSFPIPAPLPPLVVETSQSPSIVAEPSSSLPTPAPTPPPPSPPPVVAPQPVTPTQPTPTPAASIATQPVFDADQVLDDVQMEQGLLPNPFDNVDANTSLPSVSPQPPSPAPARRLGAKARRWVNGGIWEQDRWNHWRPVDELNFGHALNGENGIGLSGGVGLGGSGWGMWKGMCKARVSLLSSHIGASAIRAHEARLFGPPPTHVRIPRTDSYVRGPSPSQMEISIDDSDGGDTEPDEDQDTDTDMITEEELDWAYPDSQSQSSEEGEESPGDVMDIVVQDDRAGGIGAGGVFMEFTFPQPEPPSIRLSSIKLQELRMRDMDQFKAVFDMDALAPAADATTSPAAVSLPSSSSLSAASTMLPPSVNRTRKLDYFSRRFGYIATGTPINPRTRSIWGSASSSPPPTSLPFSPSPSDILSSASQHWGTLRRRDPPPPLPNTAWVTTPGWMSEIVGSGGGYDFSAWSDMGMGMLGFGWGNSDVMNTTNGGSETMSVHASSPPLEFPTSPSPSHSPPLGYVSA